MKTILKSMLAVGLLAGATAQAAFPDRPINLVVPYAPGGAADAVARVLANKMSGTLGVSIVVENKAGASGMIGAGYVAKATPDGYTMLYDATPFSINPHLYSKMPFDKQALAPVSLVLLAPNILIVNANSPFKDVSALVEAAKAKPGKLNFASGGSGTVQRMASELFRQKLSLDMVHIPYKSGGPAITDVMGGQVDFMFSTIAASSPLVKSGKLRALAVSAPERSAQLPDVPTVSETVIPGYEAYEWNGIFVPAGTPADVVQRLQQAIAGALKDAEVQERLSTLGARTIGSSPKEFADFLGKEDAKWAEVIRNGNIKVD